MPARMSNDICPDAVSRAACPETATACPEHGQTVTEIMRTIIIKTRIKFSH